MQRDSVANVIIVSLGLCLVCSVVVSSAAVFLRPLQEANRKLEVQKNILIASGLWDEKSNKATEGDQTVPELYENVERKLLDIDSGQFIEGSSVGIENLDNYDPLKAARDPELGRPLGKEDIAGLKNREKYTFVYLVKDSQGNVAQYVLPVRGYGLWSTMLGFIALDKDLKTISGLTFYSHGETPGLGGEIDNTKWKASWRDKIAFGDAGEVKIEVLKGAVDPNNANASSQVDGLSGATITTKGVDNMLKYWLGDNGFGPFLTNLKSEGDK